MEVEVEVEVAVEVEVEVAVAVTAPEVAGAVTAAEEVVVEPL